MQNSAAVTFRQSAAKALHVWPELLGALPAIGGTLLIWLASRKYTKAAAPALGVAEKTSGITGNSCIPFWIEPCHFRWQCVREHRLLGFVQFF
jgi:hypothetical protein